MRRKYLMLGRMTDRGAGDVFHPEWKSVGVREHLSLILYIYFEA